MKNIKPIEVAREAALEAGEMLLSNFQTRFRIAKKGRVNLVTEMDLDSEAMILQKIRSCFPDHHILAEEGGDSGEPGACKWIIDPIDGTTNYAHGFPFFCISIAMEKDERVVLGVIYDPIRHELFAAEAGEGATLNGMPIRVSEEDRLIDSLLSTGFSYDLEEMRKNLVHFQNVMLQARAVRRPGSAALDLAYVACGRFDGYWELSLNPWDVAAGLLLVEEAGGRVTAFDGSLCSIYGREYLATNSRIHEQLMEVLGG